MRILFDGVVPVDYGQIYVTSRELPEMIEAFAGQVNGLCGAGEPGALFLMTGTRCGRVGGGGGGAVRAEGRGGRPGPVG